jgi:hypothetical protein
LASDGVAHRLDLREGPKFAKVKIAVRFHALVQKRRRLRRIRFLEKTEFIVADLKR